MANYPHEKCSADAEEILKNAGYLQKGKLPINIEILSQKLGYRVHALENIYRRAGLKGTGFRKLPEDRLEIVVDAYHYDDQWFQCRFTIAEELSHLLIHKDIFKNIHSAEDRVAYERTLTDEQSIEFEGQATRLASYLLVPNVLFIPFCKEWIDNNYDEIIKDNPQDEDDLITFLADRMHHKVELSPIVLQKVFNRYLPDTSIKVLEYVITNSGKKMIAPR